MRLILLATVALLISGCLRIDHEFDRLMLVDSSSLDEENLQILVQVQNKESESERTPTINRVRNLFPPRLVIVVTGPEDLYRDEDMVLLSVEMTKQNGVSEELLKEHQLLTLRDSQYPNVSDYGDFRQIKFSEEQASAIYFSEWIEGIKLEEQYVITIKYVNPEGEEKSFTNRYKAEKYTRKELWPVVLHYFQ